MKSLGIFALGVLASIVAFYLCEKFFPFIGPVITNHPFQSFVVIALTVTMVTVIVVAVKVKGIVT